MSGWGNLDQGAKLNDVLFGQRLPTRHFEGPQAATVITAAEKTLYFRLVNKGWEQVRFGPAPYPRAALVADAGGVNAPAIPPVGTECRVDWVGFDLAQPFVLMFVDWP